MMVFPLKRIGMSNPYSTPLLQLAITKYIQ